MAKIFTTLAVLMLVAAGNAFAQDYRSPDARAVVGTQDLRSPDASTSSQPAVSPGHLTRQDLRSPDAKPALPSISTPAAAPTSGSSFDWESLAILLTTVLLIGGAWAVNRHRGRDTIALGS